MNRRTRLARITPLRSSAPLARSTPLRPARAEAGNVIQLRRVPLRTAATETGFSRGVKLACRKRAGNGDPDEALCEACEAWLGRYGGEIQHIIARGMGGCTDPLIGSIVNAALLCGSAAGTGCHWEAEQRTARMREMGFWLPSSADPRVEPMLLGGRVKVWRSADGGYSSRPPEGWVA